MNILVANMRYPKDCETRRIGSLARNIVFMSFDAAHWDVKEQTGNDVGIDCIAELSENDEWHNRKLECQIKGTKQINYLKTGLISYSLNIHTINYALSSTVPFVLLLVDVTNKETYFLPIQRYFIENSKLISFLENKCSINVHLNPINKVNKDDVGLQKLAHCCYIRRGNSLLPEELEIS